MSSGAWKSSANCASERRADYELVLTPPTRPALTGKLFEPVAAIVIEFLTTGLICQPHRPVTAARRPRRRMAGTPGTYRVLYRIHDDWHEVIILRVEHRRNAYRPL